MNSPILAHLRGRLRRRAEGGAGSGVLRPRLVTKAPGGSGPRPPGTTTWLRGARCTDPEEMPEMEARPPTQNRHGGAPRGERVPLDARRASTSADRRARQRDNRNSAPFGAPLAPHGADGKEASKTRAQQRAAGAKKTALFDIVNRNAAATRPVPAERAKSRVITATSRVPGSRARLGARASRDPGATRRAAASRYGASHISRWVPGLVPLRSTRPGHESPHPEENKPAARDGRPRSLLLSRARFRLRRWLVHHALELHAVRVGEIDRVVGGLVVLAGRIDHRHAVLGEEGAERVHVPAARKLEGVMVEADVALAVLVLLPFGVGRRDPEQRLAVAPARHVGILVLELEAEKTKQLAVEFLRAGEVADAEHQLTIADAARLGPSLSGPGLSIRCPPRESGDPSCH